jgi:two-component system, OmpR family, KDP operon response regulator KdpE
MSEIDLRQAQLRALVQRAGKVQLRNETTDVQYLRAYIWRLRQKIETSPERPQYILTETGIGYRLRAPQG